MSCVILTPVMFKEDTSSIVKARLMQQVHADVCLFLQIPHLFLLLMVSICSMTRYMTIAIVDHRDASALAMALKAIFSRSGTPKIIFSDQESGIVALAKRGSWLVANNHTISKEGITVNLASSPGTGHQRSGMVEAKIGSLKRAMGSLNMSKHLDIASLQIHIFLLEASINSIPIWTRTQGKIKSKFSTLVTRYITPSSLVGRNVK